MDISIQIRLFAYTLFIFLVIGLLVYFFPKYKDTAIIKQKHWVSSSVFLFMLFLILNYLPGFQLLAFLIMLTGLYEIIKLVPQLTSLTKRFYVIVIFYTIICAGVSSFIFQMYPVILFTCLIFIFIEGFTLLSGLLFSTSEPHSGQKSKGLLFTYAVSFIFVLLLRKELSGVGVNVGIRAFLILIFALIGRFFWILLKRKTEKRQFGSYIPGYGGVLDLFHSFIFAAAGTSILEFFR